MPYAAIAAIFLCVVSAILIAKNKKSEADKKENNDDK